MTKSILINIIFALFHNNLERKVFILVLDLLISRPIFLYGFIGFNG